MVVHGPKPNIIWSQDRSGAEQPDEASKGASEEAAEVANLGSGLCEALGDLDDLLVVTSMLKASSCCVNITYT